MSGKLIKERDFDHELFRNAHMEVDKRQYIIDMIDEYHYEKKRRWRDEEKVLWISEGNEKTHCRSYSTMPGITCINNCKFPPCFTSGNCYAIYDMMYPKVRAKAVHNTVLIEKYPEYFERSYLQMNLLGMPRLHVEGDFVNVKELDIVNKNTKTLTMAYTKHYNMVNKYFDKHEKNPNLVIIFSEWNGYPMRNPHNFPVSKVYPTVNKYIKAECDRQCGELFCAEDGYLFTKGNCSECLLHHYMNDGLGGCFDLREGMSVKMLAH